MFNFQLILYNEVEDFRNADDPLFDYPYKNSKNSFTTVAPKLGYAHFNHEDVYLQKSVVCLEDHWMDQLALYKHLYSEFGKYFGVNHTDSIYPCDSPILKFKYGRHDFIEETLEEEIHNTSSKQTVFELNVKLSETK